MEGEARRRRRSRPALCGSRGRPALRKEQACTLRKQGAAQRCGRSRPAPRREQVGRSWRDRRELRGRCPRPAATLARRQPQAHQPRLRSKRPPGPLGPPQRAALRRTQVSFRGLNQHLSPADQSDRAARQRRPVTIDRRYLGRRGSADLVRAEAARRGLHGLGGRTRHQAGARRRAPSGQADQQPAYDAQHRSADNPGSGLHPPSPPLMLPASGELAAGAGPRHGTCFTRLTWPASGQRRTTGRSATDWATAPNHQWEPSLSASSGLRRPTRRGG